MATNLEDSFHSALDYEAEVAYISLTSPLRVTGPSDDDEGEFDFSTEEQEDTPQPIHEGSLPLDGRGHPEDSLTQPRQEASLPPNTQGAPSPPQQALHEGSLPPNTQGPPSPPQQALHEGSLPPNTQGPPSPPQQALNEGSLPPNTQGAPSLLQQVHHEGSLPPNMQGAPFLPLSTHEVAPQPRQPSQDVSLLLSAPLQLEEKEAGGGLEATAKPPLMSKFGSPRPSLAELTGEEVDGGEQASPVGHSGLTGEVIRTELAGHANPIGHTELTDTSGGQGKVTGKKARSLSPLTISVANYTLDTELPSTPTSKLRRIKDAQAPPSPKPRSKLQQEEHLYCTLVIYGSSGCGRTQMVDKLALSNPSVFAKVISTTTRKKRPNEVSGVDFHYLSHQEMKLGLSRGDFIETIKVHRRGTGKRASELRKKTITQQASLQNMSPSDSSSPSTPPLISTDTDGKYSSLFDLTEEDSPVLGGEHFGTSYESLTAAIQQGKPCILLNVSTKGAQQLKQSAIQASYILIQSDSSTVPKARHGSRIKQGNEQRTKSSGVLLIPDYIISSSSLDHAYSELHDISFQLVSKLKLPSSSQYQVAQYEWEAMPTVQFEQMHSLPNQKLVEVTFSEILAHFHGANLKQQKERAKAEHSKATLFPLGRLSKRLQNEKLMVQALTYCQINDKERLHLRMLQTVHCKLTGNALTCRRFGSHWQEIGFTGVDPADDIHQVGLLGVVQLVYFLENPKISRFCKEIFQYCRKDTHIIPFVVMAFEFSQLSLEALDSGGLNKLCNKRDQVFIVVNEFYIAAFHYYYEKWKSSQKSILQLGLLMQQCGDYCRAHPRQVMQEFDKYLSIREPQNQLIPALLPKVEGAFTLFEDIKTQT